MTRLGRAPCWKMQLNNTVVTETSSPKIFYGSKTKNQVTPRPRPTASSRLLISASHDFIKNTQDRTWTQRALRAHQLIGLPSVISAYQSHGHMTSGPLGAFTLNLSLGSCVVAKASRISSVPDPWISVAHGISNSIPSLATNLAIGDQQF